MPTGIFKKVGFEVQILVNSSPKMKFYHLYLFPSKVWKIILLHLTFANKLPFYPICSKGHNCNFMENWHKISLIKIKVAASLCFFFFFLCNKWLAAVEMQLQMLLCETVMRVDYTKSFWWQTFKMIKITFEITLSVEVKLHEFFC